MLYVENRHLGSEVTTLIYNYSMKYLNTIFIDRDNRNTETFRYDALVRTYKECGARLDRQKWDTPRTTDTSTTLLRPDLETYIDTL